MYISKYNLIIEYNGTYWHCDPRKFSSDYFHKHKNITAKEVWELDRNKLYLTEKHNYNCEVIWEMDYKKDKNIINKILEKYESTQNKNYCNPKR